MNLVKRISVPVVANSARTAAAAVLSYWIAGMFRLPEAYWAPLTTLVVMQSTLGAALKISFERLAGTVLGALLGALLATYFPVSVPMFGLGVFALGIICAALDLDNAYRFAGITLAVIMLIARASSVRVIAFHRFVEVAIGILVGLALTAVWPETPTLEQAAVESQRPSRAKV
jgi:uncharacterized membrane protein YccC